MSLKQVFVVAAKRTPFGTFGGKLKDWTAVQLGTHAAKATIAAAGIDAKLIDASIWGNVLQDRTDTAYLGRHVGLQAGMSDESTGLTVNRLCGSSFESIAQACREIQAGDAEVVLTGGSESMSGAPYTVHGIRFGNVPLGKDPKMVDTLWECLGDKNINCPMAITAENLAEKVGVSKEEADALALRSQELWAKADAENLFDAEIAPITLKDRKKGEYEWKQDEHPRPQTTAEGLAKLKPLFKKDGVVSAGNASGISDGAAAVLVASEDALNGKLSGAKPLARIVSYAVAGVDPHIMGVGPVPAMKKALERASLSLDDMDLIEINEAFAAQFISCQKELGFDINKANLQGGAVAIGHPTGASGGRIMGHLVHELQRTGKKYAIGSACIGGGQGIAIILERV